MNPQEDLPWLDGRNLPMAELFGFCQKQLKAHGSCQILVSDPDLGAGLHNGEALPNKVGRQRSWKTLLELGESLGARMGTPKPADEKGLLWLSYTLLCPEKSWHLQQEGKAKYGRDSEYARVDKREDPYWLRDYRQALEGCPLKAGSKVLSLGCGRGDELSVFKNWFAELEPHMSFLGLDAEATAIAEARKNFENSRYQFEVADISEPWKGQREMDLLISIATLQSSGFEGKAVFRHWFQDALKKDGSVILGFPCCRYVDGEMVPGPKVKNFRDPEWSLLVKDLAYYGRYLSSHKKKVSIQGRNTLFLLAVPV